MTPERRERKNAARRALYERRVLAGECCDCGIKLVEGESAQRCTVCYEEDAARKSTPQAKRKAAERNRNNRLKRKASGSCRWCSSPPALGRALCERHLVEARANNRAYNARKKQGVIVLATAKREREAYVPLDEQMSAPRVRILRGLRFADWPHARDLFAQLDVHYPSAEYGSHERALSRLVRAGLVEARGKRGDWTYSLTAEGRAEADRIRRGEVPTKGAAVRRAA